MKISQELTPAAFDFGCTSAACAPPNRKGTGGTGGSIKGHTKGGGPNFKADMAQIAALSKAMGRTSGTGGTTGTGGAGGGRSSMRSSVDMDKSRAIAAARGDNTRKYANRDEKTGMPPGWKDTEDDTGDAEHRAHDAQTNTRYSGPERRGPNRVPQAEGSVNDMYERTGGVSKAAQREIDFKREQARHNSRMVEGTKAADKKRREAKASLAEYKKMIRDRNRNL